MLGSYSGLLSPQQYITLNENVNNYKAIAVIAKLDAWQTYKVLYNDNGQRGQTRMMVYPLYNQAHTDFSAITIGPYNNVAPIPAGSVITVFIR